MISIITAIYNQLDMNRLYWESVTANTDGDWELIIVDNGSTDGSREFFEALGPRVKVIANDGNYSYPYCQNRGIAVAKGDTFAFFNNDIILPPHWDSRMLKVLGRDGNEVLTLASNDRAGDAVSTRRLSHRWKRIKYPVITLFGQRRRALKAMIWLSYGSWEKFCEKMWHKYGLGLRLGFSGSAVMMTRKAVDIFGGWDPSQQAADFDMFLRTMQRAETVGDIKPMSVVGGVFHHHFRRLTMRCDYPPFADADNLRAVSDKWDRSTYDRYIAAMRNA